MIVVRSYLIVAAVFNETTPMLRVFVFVVSSRRSMLATESRVLLRSQNFYYDAKRPVTSRYSRYSLAFFDRMIALPFTNASSLPTGGGHVDTPHNIHSAAAVMFWNGAYRWFENFDKHNSFTPA